jgi:hypothetical protein
LKNFITIFLLISGFLLHSQNKSSLNNSKPAKSTTSNSKQGKYSQNSTNNITNPLPHDTCLDKKFSIVFYVILDSAYTPGVATTPTLNWIIQELNNQFKRICVSFVNCSTVYIPNYTFNKWKDYYTELQVTNSWYTDKTINFYLTDSIKVAPENLAYTYNPIQPPGNTVGRKDIIVMEKNALFISNSQILFHAVGHFFGLPHTSDELNPNPPAVPPPPSGVTSMEFANGSNCATHGDLFCDTDADGGSALQDGMGNYYLPPVDNFMSGHPYRSRFSQQQWNKMVSVIMNHPARFQLH